ncbi:GIY-YIG nuclease family protein [Streptomyces sp. NPDC050610]|uniref:GIY-YIG nuclease family protein n=1 Tax=Streptomyces sp. NPDC050610 TaxID=3157097 RepID=UPI00342B7A73
MLTKAFGVKDSQGRKWADAKYGCFAFFDYDGDPLYVGSASERLRTRIQRHLISQRTDAVAWGILDVQEVAEMELWPLWDLTETQRKLAMEPLSRAEREVYLQAVEGSRFGALLNERVPARTEHTILPSSRRFTLVDEQTRSDQGHADVRIARRAATVARLSSLFMDRGIVTEGARRAMILQSARLTHLAATQLAYVEGRPAPTAELINVPDLIGRNVSDL